MTSMITKETDAVALVVSEDGPISVFHKGKLILSYLRPPVPKPGRKSRMAT